MPPKTNSQKPRKTATSMTGSQSQDGDAQVRTQDRTRKEKAEDEEDSLQCIFCDKVFYDENDKLVECERCCEWVCQACAGLSDEAYDLIKNEEDVFHWYCQKCKRQALSEVKTGNLIEVKCKAMDAKIDRFKNELEDKLNKELIQVRDEMNYLKHSMEKMQKDMEKNSQSVESCKSEVAMQSLEELRQREGRKTNILIYNITESNSENNDERKEYDKEVFHKICDAIEVQAEAQKILRVGAKQNNKARPMKVILRNEEQQREILSSARKLGEQNEELRKISIARDMTPLEREEMKKLVKLKQEKQRLSDENEESAKWVIRKGKVINIHRREQRMLPGQETQELNPSQ